MNAMKILIADISSKANQSLKSFLEERGFQVFLAHDGDEAIKFILTQKPQLALLELMLPKQNALTILKYLRDQGRDFKKSTSSETKVIILSNQSNIHNIKECIKWGAADYLLKPLELEDIVSRVVFHLQPSRSEVRSQSGNTASNLYLHLVELALQHVTQGSYLGEVFFKVVQMTAMSLKSVRASIVQCGPHREGLVKASSDDNTGNEWHLDLRKYPEILYVMNTGKALVIENLESDPTLNQIKQYFTNITFNSLIVAPIHLDEEQLYGVLTIRMPANRHQILDEELRFSKILAQCLGLAIKLHDPAAVSRRVS